MGWWFSVAVGEYGRIFVNVGKGGSVNHDRGSTCDGRKCCAVNRWTYAFRTGKNALSNAHDVGEDCENT